MNWLEIDLLRWGARTVSFSKMPRSAYFAFADRTTPEGRKERIWPIALRDRLPRLAVPLRPGEADAMLDLQAVIDAGYEQAAYDFDADYASPPNPPLGENDKRWADGLLGEKGLR